MSCVDDPPAHSSSLDSLCVAGTDAEICNIWSDLKTTERKVCMDIHTHMDTCIGTHTGPAGCCIACLSENAYQCWIKCTFNGFVLSLCLQRGFTVNCISISFMSTTVIASGKPTSCDALRVRAQINTITVHHKQFSSLIPAINDSACLALVLRFQLSP